jgi:hypothetical protein
MDEFLSEMSSGLFYHPKLESAGSRTLVFIVNQVKMEQKPWRSLAPGAILMSDSSFRNA